MRWLSLAALLLVCAAVAQAAPQLEMKLSTGPHPPGDAPDVVAHVSSKVGAREPLELVVFLHGFDCCARSLASAVPVPCAAGERPHRAWDLAGIHERSGSRSVLVVPQLAYRARDAHHHRFAERGSFDRMVSELLARLGRHSLAEVKTVTLVAHSGGYGAVVPILRDETRTLKIETVVMLDALYAGWDVLAAWFRATPGARLVSLHTAQKQTVQGNEQLAGLLRDHRPQRSLDGSLDAAVASSPLLIARVKTAHGAIPGAHLADILRGLAGSRTP
jgi:pimeloyl-ACP methyl ester carboxylesterase